MSLDPDLRRNAVGVEEVEEEVLETLEEVLVDVTLEDARMCLQLHPWSVESAAKLRRCLQVLKRDQENVNVVEQEMLGKLVLPKLMLLQLKLRQVDGSIEECCCNSRVFDDLLEGCSELT